MGTRHSARVGVLARRGIAAAALALAGLGAQAEGLVLHPHVNEWNTARPGEEFALSHPHTPGTSIRLFGDYYFFDPANSRLGPTLGSLLGGFRASTGVAGLGQPASLWDAQPDPSQNLPYLGLGYSHFWLTGQLRFNADFGLASQNVGAAGRVRGLFNGTTSLDDVTRDLRWAPVMAVNVSYSF